MCRRWHKKKNALMIKTNERATDTAMQEMSMTSFFDRLLRLRAAKQAEDQFAPMGKVQTVEQAAGSFNLCDAWLKSSWCGRAALGVCCMWGVGRHRNAHGVTTKTKRDSRVSTHLHIYITVTFFQSIW